MLRDRPAPQNTLEGKLDRYTKAISLINTARELGKRSYDPVHFLNSSLVAGGSKINKPKIADSHFFAESYFALAERRGWAWSIAESVFCRYLSLIDRNAYRDLKFLVAGSAYQERCMRSHYGLRNTQSIHPGIDTQKLREAPKLDLNARYRPAAGPSM
jgi:hypothetical protein